VRLSQTVVYALRAALQLAQAQGDSPVPCSRLATEGGMPERFLLQILRNLVTHGILASTRGVDGGYRLLQSVDEVSLLDVIEAVDGPLLTDSPDSDGLPPECHARLQCAIADVMETARRKFKSIKLADLLPVVNGQTSKNALTKH
jgi:Rrf2 family protein